MIIVLVMMSRCVLIHLLFFYIIGMAPIIKKKSEKGGAKSRV